MRSVKLCVVLLAAIALAAVLGSLIHQGLEPDDYSKRFGPAFGKWIVTLGIDDLYHSPWFLGLLGLLGINICACAVHRLALRTLPVVSAVTHGSLLLVLVGGLIDLGWGEDGYVQIARGAAVREYVDSKGRPRPLGFRLELADFRIENEPAAQRILGFKCARPPLEKVLAMDGSREYDVGAGFRVRILRDVPEFSEQQDVPEGVRRIEALRGPAILVAVVYPGGREERRWLFGANPLVDINSHADPSVRVAYMLRPVVRDYVSTLAAGEGESPARGEARSNSPFRHRGYSFTQFSYDESALAWSALRVTREPGEPLLLTGLILLMGGVAVRVAHSLVKSRRSE